MKEWKLALPLHVEYRTFPMLFYVPPLLPVMSSKAAARRGNIVKHPNDLKFDELVNATVPKKAR